VAQSLPENVGGWSTLQFMRPALHVIKPDRDSRRKDNELGMMAQDCNPSTWESKAGGS
jgi:hypothetical protein